MKNPELDWKKRESRDSPWYFPLVLLSAALGLGLRMAWIMRRDAPGNFHWFFDESEYYLSTAANCFNGRGFFPDYNWKCDGVFVPPPLQSLFLLLIFKITGSVAAFPAQLVQALFATLALVLSAEIGRFAGSWRCGVLLAFLAALFPPFIHWTAYLMTESNYLFLLSLTLYLLCRWLKNPAWSTALPAALLLGLAHLQRVNALLLGPLLTVFSLIVWRNRQGMAFAIIFLLAPLLPSLPWLARNLKIYGEPILVSSNSGILFHFGNRLNLDPIKEPYWDVMNHDHGPTGPWIPELEEKYRGENGRLKTTWFKYSQAYLSIAKTYLLHHPIHFLKNNILKFMAQFYLVPRDQLLAGLGFSDGIQRLLHNLILYGGMGEFFLLTFKKRTLFTSLILLFFLYFAFMGSLFPLTQDGRMGIYLKFFLLIFCAVGVDAFISFIRRSLEGGP